MQSSVFICNAIKLKRKLQQENKYCQLSCLLSYLFKRRLRENGRVKWETNKKSLKISVGYGFLGVPCGLSEKRNKKSAKLQTWSQDKSSHSREFIQLFHEGEAGSTCKVETSLLPNECKSSSVNSTISVYSCNSTCRLSFIWGAHAIICFAQLGITYSICFEVPPERFYCQNWGTCCSWIIQEEQKKRGGGDLKLLLVSRLLCTN